MSSNVRFCWNNKRQKAAQLLVEGELTDKEIARMIGISERQLRRWKAVPQFRSKLEALQSELEKVSQRYAVGRLARRIAWLDARLAKLRQIVEQRAADPTMQVVPGGTSGLLVREVKGVGSGDQFRTIETYHVDGALLKEMREHEKQAAIELGQWMEKKDLTAGGAPFKVYVGVDIDRV
jgi:hypothetical protein